MTTASAVRPASFIRHKGGSICNEPEHAPDRTRQVNIQRTVENLMRLTAQGGIRFKLTIPVVNTVNGDACYFGLNESTTVALRGRWKTNRNTGKRYISFLEVKGPACGQAHALARYRLEPDGGVMYAYIWAVSNNLTAQIDQALANMVEELNSPV